MTQEQIDNNLTTTLKKGDKVIMYNCLEGDSYKDKIWICKTDSFLYPYGDKEEMVFLEGFSGCFVTEYLKKDLPL
ncbi:hypothetical protein [Adhaeribacter aquaticus]|uniref:hypothetical protein n=1 Tax=Adhaeribacter aquaticus TaxID=299567 RepID=UPI0003F6034A|nr:hypothetical protein [Adhaeribacter aquaticus]